MGLWIHGKLLSKEMHPMKVCWKRILQFCWGHHHVARSCHRYTVYTVIINRFSQLSSCPPHGQILATQTTSPYHEGVHRTIPKSFLIVEITVAAMKNPSDYTIYHGDFFWDRELTPLYFVDPKTRIQNDSNNIFNLDMSIATSKKIEARKIK